MRQEGSVAECGKHADLMQSGGIYADMWNRQAEYGMSKNASAQSLVSEE